MKKIKFDIKRIILSLLALLVFISTPLYKNVSEKYIDSTLKDAIVTYAILRGINAGVSVIQESSLTLGVGIDGTVALGQILDPINDAVERFSDMMTIYLWVLGAEKIVFEISQMNIIYIFLILAILGAIFIKNELFNKILILLILIRLFVPFSAIFSDYANKDIFAPQIEKNRKILKNAENKEIKIDITEKNSGFWHSVRSSISNVNNSFTQFKERMNFYIANSSKIMNALIDLSILYFSKFLLNLILLPLLFIYFLKNINIKE
jgi:hypothetical protein